MPSLLRLARRRAPAARPLSAEVAVRIRLSADLLGALLDVEQRSRATLDDIEWADAVADRLIRRRLALALPPDRPDQCTRSRHGTR
jgi:hypothetical protein